MSKTFLGVDGGASSGKWCLLDEAGTKLEENVGAPIDGHIYRVESRSRLTQFLTTVKSSIETQPSAAHIGLTGAPETLEAQREIRELFSFVFGEIPLVIENDVFLGYRAAFGDEAGIFLYAGTGSIVVYREASGSLKRVGGWGYLLGDEGGGYWIGREGIRKTLLALENNEQIELAKVIFEHAGGRDWDSIKRFVYSSSREQIASLALPILTLAEAGNKEAGEIANIAGVELAFLVKRTEKKLNSKGLRVIFSGGIASDFNLVTRALEVELGRTIESFSGDTAYQAALIARENYSAGI